MNDVRLITVEDLKESTSISKSIEPALIEPYLEISEEYYCKDILGDALITELKYQITGGTLTELNQYLLTSYIRPLIAYGAWLEYIPFSAVKIEQKGEMRQTGENSASATLEELSLKTQSIRAKISHYQKRLGDYLNKNQNNFPSYRTTCSKEYISNNWNIYLGKSN